MHTIDFRHVADNDYASAAVVAAVVDAAAVDDDNDGSKSYDRKIDLDLKVLS